MSYTDAGSLVDPPWINGTLVQGVNSIYAPSFVLGTPAPAALRLGATVDTETASPNTVNADGDDVATSDDEDGVASLVPLQAEPGAVVTQVVTCAGTGFVSGWVDWNRNGSFAAGEMAPTVPCSGGVASLTWSVPSNVLAGFSYMRVRIATTVAESADPTGVVRLGEVEDYRVNIVPVAVDDVATTVVNKIGRAHV